MRCPSQEQSVITGELRAERYGL